MSEALIRRRDFLHGTVALAAPLAGLGALPAHALEPIPRKAEAQMRLSLAAYSFRDALKSDPPRMTLHEGFIDFAVEQGLSAIEPTSYYFPEPLTQEYLLNFKRQAFLNGLDISGTAIGNVFTHPPGADREKELAHTRTWIDHAAAMGAPCIRVFAGKQIEGTTFEEAQKYCIETMELACEYAGTKGIILALENHGGIVETADQLLAIAKAVSSPWFGINLDTGNFHSSDPYQEMEQAAPYAVNVQVKAEIKVEDQDKQPADYGRIIDILKKSGYRGYVALEYEAEEDPLTAIPTHLARLQSLI